MTSPTHLQAVQHVKRMRGGTQPHLMRASDGNYYVVKFTNNPSGNRALASEFFATQLALSLGLPVAPVCIIDVPLSLVMNTQALRIEAGKALSPCAAGLQLGCRCAADPMKDRIFDHMPESQFHRVENRVDLLRMLTFDKWVGNCDGRQAVFVKQGMHRNTA